MSEDKAKLGAKASDLLSISGIHSHLWGWDVGPAWESISIGHPHLSMSTRHPSRKTEKEEVQNLGQAPQAGTLRSGLESRIGPLPCTPQ